MMVQKILAVALIALRYLLSFILYLLSFNWFGSIWSKVKDEDYTGVNDDVRPQEEKDKDYLHEERVLASAAANVFGNQKITVSPYPLENQNFTFSCVPHGVGLALAIERKMDTNEPYTHISPMFAYRLRSNYPGEGSFPQEIFEIFRTKGAPLYSTMPTPKTEKEANNMFITPAATNEAAIFKGKKYFTLTTTKNDINELARIAQEGHGIAITIFATTLEWAREYPMIQSQTLVREKASIRHEVCILPKSGFIENGTKFVTVQDSTPFGGIQIRHLSEDFIARRVFDAGYWDTVASYGGGPKPSGYTFTKILKVGSTGDEVFKLQVLLISENLLPQDCATGTFGGLTLAGVRAFQNKYSKEILVPLGLSAPTNIWGSACIAHANILTH